MYDRLWQDEDGDPRMGDRAYELALSPPPPGGAFWSLTMYDMPSYYLVATRDKMIPPPALAGQARRVGQ